MDNDGRDRVVVLGGSIAGLLTARVLADHYAEVLVVDRDRLDDPSGVRRGTPQARQSHALLARGHELLEGMFPGLTAELVAEGAPRGDMLADTRLCFGGHRFARGTSGLTMLNLRRPTLEEAVRRRVLALPGVRLLGGRDVVGLVTDRGARRVVGARVIGRDDGSAEEELDCDTVVVATGRGSRLPAWQESLGLTRPAVERMRVDVCYVSREYALDPGLVDVLASLSGPTPRGPRGGAFARVDGDRCLVTLLGMLGECPPTDDRGFLEFAAVVLPDVSGALRAGVPLTEAAAHRHPTSLWHRYDRSHSLPEGVLVVGDAVCALNPIYGQGMTVAALEAAALREHLARGPVATRRFQRDVGRVCAAAWALSTGGDLAFPEVVGRRTLATRALGRYVDRVQARAEHDPGVGGAFLRVTSMVDPPAALLRPEVLARAAGVRPAA